MNQEDIRSGYDEINLIDYVKVLIKRKRLLFSVFLAIVLAAFVFSVVSQKIYKVGTSLEIGKLAIGVVPEVIQPVEEPAQVVGKIKSDAYGVPVREKLGISEREYPQIKVENPQNTNLIIIVVESGNTELAKNIILEISNIILREHQEKLNFKRGLVEKDIQLLKESINVYERDIERINIKIASLKMEQTNLDAKVQALQAVLPYQQDPGTQFALFDAKEKLEKKKQEIEERYLEINSLENKINSTESQIGSLQRQKEDIVSTRVVKEPTISETPVQPKLLLNLALAAILGLFLGVMFAFAKEWWERSK